MCFTIHIRASRDAIEKRFKVDTGALDDFQFRFFYKAFDNPVIPVISQQEPGRVSLMNWGLIPHWCKDHEQAVKVRSGTYNARAESLDEKASFKTAYENRRCLVIVNGFFEWQHQGKEKIPWFIQRKDRKLFAMAGLYDTWKNPESGETTTSFSIVTTHANPLMAKIHNSKKRMPMILDEDAESLWIEPLLSATDAVKLKEPFNENLMKAHTISKKISLKDADPDSPEIISRKDYYVGNSLFPDNND